MSKKKVSKKCIFCEYLSFKSFSSVEKNDVDIISKWVYDSNMISEDSSYEISKILRLDEEPYNSDDCLAIAHGTKCLNVKSILDNGFTGKSRVYKYGEGTYFSDVFWKSTMYSRNAHDNTICKNCNLINCCLICFLPIAELNNKNSDYKIKAEYKTLNNKNLVTDYCNRKWHFMNEEQKKQIKQKELVTDNLFNEFVISGRQLVPKLLLLTRRCDK